MVALRLRNEVDECTVAHFRSGNKTRPKSWSAYIGFIRRGSPRNFIVHQMRVRDTKERSPGPGPITKSGRTFLLGCCVICSITYGCTLTLLKLIPH
eukprot:1458146-Amphidinium_carterae.2